MWSHQRPLCLIPFPETVPGEDRTTGEVGILRDLVANEGFKDVMGLLPDAFIVTSKGRVYNCYCNEKKVEGKEGNSRNKETTLKNDQNK